MKKNIFKNTIEFAEKLDRKDELADFQNYFYFPKIDNKRSHLYFCGNSLGLQPKRLKDDILQEINDWKNYGVEGHLEAKNPWFSYHELLNGISANLVGAKENEVVVMNSLTVNLHLLMISFYQPNGKKKKILIEGNPFPSDLYAVKSQLKLHNNDPENDLIIIKPNRNNIVSTDRILDAIKSNKDDIALILLGGVNYLTGQLFDIKKITEVAKEYNCIIGLDLAHAVGNVNLKLSEWGVDFAAWCGYKYLNGGPGAPSGVFINSKYFNSKTIKRLEGWWGHSKLKRFDPDKEFKPILSAEAWQLSNPPILSMAGLLSSLTVFEDVGMQKLIKKSHNLTSYLEFLLKKNLNRKIEILTPEENDERGCQLSIKIIDHNDKITNLLYQKSVVCDFRKPDILRIAPVPLYNSYLACYQLVDILKGIMDE